jgi:hypothetical protein
MIVNATTSLVVKITNETIRKICLKVIYHIYDWDEGFFIEAGSLYRTETLHGSHAWNRVTKIRDASETDTFVVDLINKIKMCDFENPKLKELKIV